MKNKALLDKLLKQKTLKPTEMLSLLTDYDPEDRLYAASLARKVTRQNFTNLIYTRGLIEMTNYCKNDCLYCGIRVSNKKISRYRLTKDDIMSCCAKGYELGFRTFVLQGGEDPYYSDELLTDIVKTIRQKYQNCAITLSLGERSAESYQKLFSAGANRYLLRHETANKQHYHQLHDGKLSFDKRRECLQTLREIGFQTGCGLMIGSPYQSKEDLVEDLFFMEAFRPHMIGVGPFIPHHDTPFKDFPAGSAEETTYFISILRMMHPYALIPATTALGTIKEDGRETGILSGCNIVMPNLSPLNVREKYMLYDNKISSGAEAAESLSLLSERMQKLAINLLWTGEIIQAKLS